MTISEIGGEGGWGWLVATASFFIHAIIGGIGYSSGVWQMIFSEYFGKNQYQTAWLSSVLLGMTVLGGIPSTLIVYRYGCRASVVWGGIIACAGFALAVFCMEIYELFLTFGVTVGLGFGLALTPSVMILGEYFQESRHLAAGLATTGISFGIVIFPLGIYFLEEMYTWKGVVVIFVALCANLVLCGAIMRPKVKFSRRKTKELLKIFDPTLFKNPAFTGLLFSNFTWSAGAVIIFTYLPEYAMSTGASQDDAVFLLGVVGISNFFSRTIFQLFNHSAKLDTMSNVLCSAGLAVLLTGLFPEFFQHKAGEIGYSILFGLHCGFWSTFVSSVAVELLTEESVARGRGYITLSIGLGLMLGPPGAGFLLDKNHDFETVFYISGSCLLVSSLVMLAVSVKKCYYRPVVEVSPTNSSSSLGSRSIGVCSIEEEQLIVTSLITAL